jgi:hypothetical protein
MTDQELRDLVARLAQAQENAEKAREETEKEMKRLLKVHAETSKIVGGLGNSMDWFTEDLIYPSLRKILFEQFKVDFTTESVRVYRHGTEMGLDAFGYSYGERSEAYIVKIEGTFGEEGFQQFLKTLQAFPRFFPEHADKPVYGLVAAVTMPENIRQRLLKAGIYVAHIHDNICTLRVPRGFKAKAFHGGRRA